MKQVGLGIACSIRFKEALYQIDGTMPSWAPQDLQSVSQRHEVSAEKISPQAWVHTSPWKGLQIIGDYSGMNIYEKNY